VLRTFFAIVTIVGMAHSVVADEPAKGVEPGQVLPGPFNAYIVFGGPKPKPPVNEPTQTVERVNHGDPSRAGKFHDLVTRYGLNPTVAIIAREAPPAEDQPLAQLIKWLDQSVQKNRNERLHAFAIFLRLNNDFLKDDTRIPQINQIKDFATKLDLKETPLAIDLAESDRTKAFRIGGEDAITVLVFDDHLKVRNRFVFTADKPLDEAGIKSIQDAVSKLIKK